MTFYMYRAQSDENYPTENVNMGDLPGVMWYLHNEVVVSTPRKFNVTRIIRFRVTMRATWEHSQVSHYQFGAYTAFDTGMCTVPNCDSILQQSGYVVGCQRTSSAQGLGNYVSLSSVPCQPPNCKEGAWYSLPGPCPLQPMGMKGAWCNQTSPGGMCPPTSGSSAGTSYPVGLGSGCTYYTTWAGEIYLNELIGLPTSNQVYESWWKAGNQEYSVAYDIGICSNETAAYCNFWDGRNDQARCSERQRAIESLFDAKFPDYPSTQELGESPPCDVI
jgi:hypothetical protein